MADLIQHDMITAVSIAKNATSLILTFDETPQTVNYSPAGGYVYTCIDGDCYIRDIYIQDKLDKATGTAYYLWGSIEECRLLQAIKAKYPVAKRTTTTYDYVIEMEYGPVVSYKTPGFIYKSTLMATALDCYQRSTRTHHII